jgi:hypothetical protein
VRDGGVSEQSVELLRELYATLLDPARTSAPGRLRLAGDPGSREAAARLRDHFRAHPGVPAVELEVGGVLLGVATPATVAQSSGYAAESAFATGEGASLPGRSARFRDIRWTCRDTACTESALRAFYDERFPPACPSAHGPMEFVA